MSTAAPCHWVTLTIQISEVLFNAIQIDADILETSVSGVIAYALLQTQIAFFADNGESQSDVAVLDVRAAAPSPPRTRTRGDLGALQRAVLTTLLTAPAVSEGVYDLQPVRRAMLHSHYAPNVSRAVRQLVKLGVLVPMTATKDGFRPDAGELSRVRYVSRAAGN